MTFRSTVVQDGDEEGILRLDRMPIPEEAEEIRAVLGIRRRRHLSPEILAGRPRVCDNQRAQPNLLRWTPRTAPKGRRASRMMPDEPAVCPTHGAPVTSQRIVQIQSRCRAQRNETSSRGRPQSERPDT
jgi:hypothetical protein